ncbi:SDR family NAD(P)-dependent oxidoreductase [Paenibacillus durus]|uniref:SDR family NAD(P)-dependent oxidoreductase n=1 Tax=Paenibacillus durus TaxID=44251 RepID=UPI0005A69AFD|nr:SDR family NAD(P)-dependent oxidoreductase [Paenibacillus durus]
MTSRKQETFVQLLTHNNYIVQNHRVHGICTLPGVTLLDMIYRLSAIYLGTQDIELRHILFTLPIVTSEQFDRQICVTFTPAETKTHWTVSVTSKKVENHVTDHSSEENNMECQLYLMVGSSVPPAMNVQAFIDQSDNQWDMDAVYQLARQVDIEHGTFMKTRGTVYQRKNEELMHLHLSDQALQYADQFYAHVAFLDGSTFAGASFRLSGKNPGMFLDETPYIPFMIDRFRIFCLLPDTIYTYSTFDKSAENQQPKTPPDIVTTDITVYDKLGNPLVEFERLTAKRIRNPYLMKKLVVPGHYIWNEQELNTSIRSSQTQQSEKERFKPQVQKIPNGNSTKSLVVAFLKDEIAKVLGKPEEHIDLEVGFYQMGLDSIELIGLSKMLEQKVKQQLYPTLLFEYSNINSLSEFLLENWPEAFGEGGQAAPQLPNTEAVSVHSVQDPQCHESSQNKTLILEPCWDQAALKGGNKLPHDRKHVVILYEGSSALRYQIQQGLQHAEVIALVTDQPMPYAFELLCGQLMEWMQQYLQQSPIAETVVQVVASRDRNGVYAAALGALLKSAHAENPRLHGQVILSERIDSLPVSKLVNMLKEEWASHKTGVCESYYAGPSYERMVKRYTEKTDDAVGKPIKTAEGGVYVITGGLGALGLSVAGYFASRGKVKLALIGRSALTAAHTEQIKQLAKSGAEAHYLQADIAQKEEVQHVIQHVRDQLGPIKGIVHCAGLTKDQFIVHKTQESIREVLRPKVRGLWHLNELTREEPLDFFVLFSSLSAVLGNMGQADYACGNAFMDIFAEQRRLQAAAGRCSGVTVSINWPLWMAGGMGINDNQKQHLSETIGLVPLPKDDGLALFESILRGAGSQAVILYGKEERIRLSMHPYLTNATPRGIPQENKATCTLFQAKAEKVYASPNETKVSNPAYKHEDIAIIGVAGRYPMARNVNEFGRNLSLGKDCITGFPKDRWERHRFSYEADQLYQYGGFIDQIDRFDPLFFNLSPRQVEMMDPQARLFLETAWEACEDAGFYLDRSQHHYPSSSSRSVGVFAGVFWNHYELFASELTERGVPTSLGVSAASVANMVSYCMNFHGPSLAVDTMCSSALTAIHLACESIKKGECHYALTGGVNLITHPHKYMFLKQAQLLASDGRCRSFGEGGDGYVPAEGVGTVLLTSLSHAEAAGYSIYGVIKGSAINHGGKTSGATVPDSTAQAEVILEAFKHSRVDPRTISYFETHGTGTSLGDPIEIQGLEKALTSWKLPRQSCPIGSLKSNIGHLEAAAGVAGLTKVLLQFKYKKIFPSLHADRLNPYIPFQDTSFYVEREGNKWTRPEIKLDGKVEVHPRRAGISSFGANGSNAHLVVEEYSVRAEREKLNINRNNSTIVPISAKSEPSLMESVENLLNYLTTAFSEDSDVCRSEVDLTDLAYTLQVGREPMRYRAAFVVSSMEELIKKLSDYVKEMKNGTNKRIKRSTLCYQGEVKNDNELTGLFQSDDDVRTAVNSWITKRKISQLAEVWTKGISLDWSALYENVKPRRISLPTYPFARERYWVPMAEASEAGDRAGSRAALLHPLLHRNLSDLLNGQRYGTTFTGEEEFLADHVVQGRKLLPGVVYLEMARAAVEQAAAWTTDKHSLLLRHVVWSRPLSVGEEPAEVQIALYPEEDGTISYDIYGQTAACGDEVYSQGNVALGSEAGKEASLDLTALRSRCSRGRVTAETCYALFQTMGLAYGPSHQAIEELYRGEGEALAKLKLPESLFDKQAECMLHPGMVDAALQASIALLAEEHLIAWDRNASDVKSREAAALPFALEEAEVLRPCASSMWAVVQYRAGRGAPEKVRKLDIALCDEAGHVCVWLRGVTSRSPEAREGLLLLEPVWEEVSERASGSEPPVYREHRVLFCESATEWTGELSARWSKAHCVRLGAAGGIAERFEVYALAVFEEIRERMKVPGEGLTLLQVVIPGSGESELVAGLTGLLRTARLENSRLVGQLIEVEAGTAADTVAEQLQAGAGYLEETHLRIAGGQLQRAGWQEYEADARGEEAAVAEQEAGAERLNRQAGQGLRHPWKAGGVYVITGGGGGLGRIFAEEIAQRAQGATLILTGRSAELPESTWRELEQLPAQVLYEPVDVTDAGAVEELMMRIRQTYGRVNGILHSAGVTRDSLIRNKTADEWREVLAPKVAGTVNLDEACREDELDLLILFSSGAGATGNIGQADYAAANAFMDRYAQRRNEQVKAGERRGRTLSVSWPLWEAGGMQVSEEQRDRLLGQTGLRPLRTETGIAALYRGLASSSSQVLVAEGNLPKLRRRLLSVSAMAAGADAWAREAHGMTAEANAQYAPALFAEEQRQEKDTLEARSFSEQAPSSFQGQASGLEAVIVRQVAELLQVEECAINPEADWSEYGLDPVQLAEVAHRLRDRQGWELSPAWLLEQPNVCEAAKYAAEQIRRIKKPDIRLLHNAEGVSMEAALTEAGLEEQAVQYVKQRLAGVIGLPESRIEADAPMEQYGIDSILIMQMTDELETDFGSLPKTLFFEYQTIRALSGYFIEAHSERLRSLLKEGKPGAASAVAQARAVAGKSGAKAAVQKRQPAVSEEPPFAARARAAAASGRRGSPWDTDLPLLGRPAFRRERLRVESHSPLAGGVVREAEQEIAIIGMAGRYPGARNVEQFWQNLRSGKDSITEIPTSRWDHRRYYDAAPGTAGKTYGQWGGFLDGVDEFDPLFFNVSPREAEMMDPQERLFMQCVYETLEDAGYTRESLSPQAVGVYVGVMYEEYQLYGAQSSIALSGNPSSIANRVSYFCNFRGPSMAVDTMCSSSLTAIHLACQSLRQQECGVAVAGGVNVSVHPNKYVMLAQGRFLSSKGRCESFGRGGDGYVPGEGVGAVLLKPLSRAVADGDRIYGVIKGSALNHGGKTNGYTVPNPKAQAEVIEQALKEAGIDARTISYVEAHGTGTSLGDPIEVAGLSKAFGGPAEKPYCAIGSAKSNIGHGESAAGIAGVTKVLLQMQHGELAPSLHAKETNPHIDFSRSPFTVQQELGPWERPVMEGERLPRRAGISSFGAGGANAHVIIEEYRETRPNQQAAETPERPVMIVLSAKSAERLKAQAEQLLEALQSGVYGGCTLADVGYTLQVGREALEERLGLLAESLEELTSKLQAYVEGADEGKATAGEGFFYRGQAKGGREALSVFAGEEEMQEMVSRWLQRGKYGKVLEVWTRGLAVNWLEQYGETEKHRPRRISLPTYPFVRDRYWVPMTQEKEFVDHSDRDRDQQNLHLNMSGLNHQSLVESAPADNCFMLTPVWEPIDLKQLQESPSNSGNWVMIGGTVEQLKAVRTINPHTAVIYGEAFAYKNGLVARLEQIGEIDHVIWSSTNSFQQFQSAEEILGAQEQGVMQVFQCIKSLLSLGYGGKPLEWTLLTYQAQSIWPSDPVNPADASIHGLVGSMSKEFPHWKVRLADLENERKENIRDVIELPFEPAGNAFIHRHQMWYKQELVRLEPVLSKSLTAYRKGGVYVVIGGAGGIGEAWSEYMIRTYQAKIIWVGRTRLNKEIQSKQDRLNALGTLPEYIAADASNYEELLHVYKEIKRKHNTIHGVVHSAIVLLDRSLNQMEEDRFRGGLSPKIDVSVRLSQVFKKENLDFVLFFSSMNSFTKMAGQSNYAAGCVFKDAFAHWLKQQWRCPVKIMNWGYWGSVGTVASKKYRERMQQMGIDSIEAPEAMNALELLLAGPLVQAAFIKTVTPLLPGVNMQKTINVYERQGSSVLEQIQVKSSNQLSQKEQERHKVLNEMEPMLAKLLWGQLRSAGWFNPAYVDRTSEELTYGLTEVYRRWLKESLIVLVRHGYLTLKEDHYSISELPPTDLKAIWQEWEESKRLWIEHSGAEAQITLVETMLRALPDILTGKCLATEIMFPNASMELVGGIYK